MLNFKKRSWAIVLAAVALLVVVSVGFAVNRTNDTANVVYTTRESMLAALSKHLPRVAVENLTHSGVADSESDEGEEWIWRKEGERHVHKAQAIVKDGVLVRYRYDNSSLDIPENPIDFDATARMALDFAYDFIPEGALTFENKPFEYADAPENTERWVARSAYEDVDYIIEVNTLYGYVAQFFTKPIPAVTTE